MVLIIGGEGSGKKSFAMTLGYTEDRFSTDPGSSLPVVYGLEEKLRNDPSLADTLEEKLVEKEAVICCEVGSGVIPLSPEERAYREAVGRLTIRLAKRADCVVRMVAGIPVVIKGNVPCA